MLEGIPVTVEKLNWLLFRTTSHKPQGFLSNGEALQQCPGHESYLGARLQPVRSAPQRVLSRSRYPALPRWRDPGCDIHVLDQSGRSTSAFQRLAFHSGESPHLAEDSANRCNRSSEQFNGCR